MTRKGDTTQYKKDLIADCVREFTNDCEKLNISYLKGLKIALDEGFENIGQILYYDFFDEDEE